jgi:hypothetical protein
MGGTTQTKPIVIYTQHQPTINLIKETCGEAIIVPQDRTKDPVDLLSGVLSQIGPAVLYAVIPVDQALLLRQRVPHVTIRLLQLDGAVIEALTKKPYNPKEEYSLEIIRQALKIIEIKDGSVRYFTSFKEMIDEIVKQYRRIGVFNDTMRQGIQLALQRLGVNVELVKTCGGGDGCVEVNPLGFKSGYRVSFPGAAGRLTPEQIAEALLSGTARIYYVEVVAEVVPLCE